MVAGVTGLRWQGVVAGRLVTSQRLTLMKIPYGSGKRFTTIRIHSLKFTRITQ